MDDNDLQIVAFLKKIKKDKFSMFKSSVNTTS